MLAEGKGLSVKTLGETVVKDLYGKADKVDGGQDHGSNAADQDGVFGDDSALLTRKQPGPGSVETHSLPKIINFLSYRHLA